MKITLSIRSIIMVVLAFSIISCSRIRKLYVSFAEAKVEHAQQGDDVIRLYFDRFGFIYPDAAISDKDMFNSVGRLNKYYMDNCLSYNEICAKYNVMGIKRGLNTSPTEDPLQEALLKNYAENINHNMKDKELVFIIHGFNEYPKRGRDSSSFDEMNRTRKVIEAKFKDKHFLFVEIYWDGLSHEGGAKMLRKPNSLKIWNNAQVSATHSGLELRRLFSKVVASRINVITHSHGAGVITTALFNVIKFKDKYYERKGHWLYEVAKKYSMVMYNTPTQEFHIGMLAPAIPGQNVFDEYYCRTEGGVSVSSTKKNYHFILGYNEHDPVTGKFKVAARKLGSTTLGCKADELLRTENIFADEKVLDHIDFSKYADGTPQADHSWFEYLKNAPSIHSFLDKVFE